MNGTAASFHDLTEATSDSEFSTYSHPTNSANETLPNYLHRINAAWCLVGQLPKLGYAC